MPTKVSTIQTVRPDINPQLAKVYNPDKISWEKPWMTEPKFDGLRCITVVERSPADQVHASAYSRNGKPLWNMGIVLKEVIAKAQPLPLDNGMVLDGEIYTKDWNLSMGIVKSSVTEHEDADKLHYHVWDCLTLKEWHTKYTDHRSVKRVGVSRVSNYDRKQRLAPWSNGTNVELVEHVLVHNHKQLMDQYQNFLTQGYEGAILKNPDGIYECGRRSPNWLKLKPYFDADLTVVGSYPGEGKHVGRIGGLVLEGDTEWNDRTYHVKTEVGTGFTDEERETFQAMVETQNLIGRIVEITHEGITVDGACRFPVYHRLRTDKE